jgi:hypothetical protein
MRIVPAIVVSLVSTLFFSATCFAQKDSAVASINAVFQKDSTVRDTVIVKNPGNSNIIIIDTLHKFNPHTAIVRSAIIPGWGQAYNKQYWKIPIIYGALGTTAAIFFYNVKEYNKLRKAYSIRLSGDSASFSQIDPELKNLSTPAIGSYRTEFRQNVDYSVLVFILFWGINVVDATVSAHLKSFDISDDLSLNIHPRFDPLFKTSGLSFVLNIGNNKPKSLTSLPKIDLNYR